jgi:ribosomal protein S18 acetylase RimI-like enzyme
VRAFDVESAGRLPGLSFRPICEGDMDFLSRLYASTRAEELAAVAWRKEQKDAFLDDQFQAQHRYYHQQFGQAAFLVVEQQGRPIGRVYLDRRADELRLVDIALMPESRGQGIGTTLLREVLEECRERGLPTRIHVEKNNPAMSLYRRLGFESIEDQGVYELMEWRPS